MTSVTKSSRVPVSGSNSPSHLELKQPYELVYVDVDKTWARYVFRFIVNKLEGKPTR